MSTYGILNANRDEVGERTHDWDAIYNKWFDLYQKEIVFLVKWVTDTFFVVLRPK